MCSDLKKKPTLAHSFKQASARVAVYFASEANGDSSDIKLQKERYTTLTIHSRAFALTLVLRALEAAAQGQYQGLQEPITLSLIDGEINYHDNRQQTLNELLDARYATVIEVRQVEDNLSALQQQREKLIRPRESEQSVESRWLGLLELNPQTDQ